MEYNNNSNFLLIDKMGDYFYFKDMKSISKYLDKTYSQIVSIYRHSQKHYVELHSSGYYIQNLYNNELCRQPKNTSFIWDIKSRNIHNTKKYSWVGGNNRFV